MTFLNPAVLIALAAAAIPLILHLINLRKLRKVDFSTISFLKELQKTSIRRLKLRQLLLLLLRTLLIVFLVLAFARPALRGTSLEGAGTRARTTAVILIDDSFSMTATDENGQYLNQARESARQVLQLFTERDEIHLIPFSTPLASRGTAAALASAFDRLDDISPSPIHGTLEDALRVAGGIFAASDNLTREIYVISDLQEGLLRPRQANDDDAVFPPAVNVYVLPIGSRSLRNLAVESLSLAEGLVEVGRPVNVDVTVGNRTDAPASSVVLSLFLDGTRVAQKGISVPEGVTSSTSFSVIPASEGFHVLRAEIESDDLEFDNARHLTFHIPGRIRLLLVGSPSETRYLRLALEAWRQTGSTLGLTAITHDRLMPESLSRSDVVFLTEPSAISAAQAERLNAFVRNGGGLAVFAGASASAPVLRTVGLPSIQSIESLGDDAESFASFEQSELRHPLFTGMFAEETTLGNTARALESPRIRRFARILPSEHAAAVITLSGGSPFLLDQSIERGRAILVAVAPTLEWSDLPLKGLFVPLIQRSAAYLSQHQVTQPSVQAGETVRFPLTAERDVPLTVLTPGKIEGSVVVEPGRPFTFDGTAEIGIYQLRSGQTVVRTFSVNLDPAESQTKRADDAALTGLMSRLGIEEGRIRRIPHGQTVEAAVLETRHGIELWKFFLVAALVMALIEMWLSRGSSAEHSRQAVTA